MRRNGIPQGSDRIDMQALGAPPVHQVSDEDIDEMIAKYGDCDCCAARGEQP